jgi:hypothetical protein
MAGESARAAAHTKRVKAEQLLRRAEAFERGADGEEATARALGALSAEGWRVFHDVRWPGRSQANIDHVLVGPGGVFVIDTKSWNGDIEVRSGQLRQDGKRRARHVIASSAAAMAIGELLPGLGHKLIHPVICFARAEPVFGWCSDVMVCSTDNIVTFLTSRPRVLDETLMTDVSEVLAASLQAASKPVPAARATYAGDGAPAAPEPRRVSPPRRKRLPRAPIPESVKLVALIGAAAVAAAVAFQLDLPARLGDLGADAAHRVVAPTEPIGTTVSVPGLAGRPPLEVTAGRPVATRSRLPGVQVTPGHQLVAIPVAVRNTGEKAWKSHSDVRAELTDSAGTTYSSDPAYTKVTGGPALPASITLAAQQRTRGFVVFEVPRGTQVAKLRLRVGPGLPTTLRWTVG